MADELPDEADFDIPSDDEEPVFDLGDDDEDDFGNKRPSEIALPPAKKARIDPNVLGAPPSVRVINSNNLEEDQLEENTISPDSGALPILQDSVHTPEKIPDDAEPPDRQDVLEEEIQPSEQQIDYPPGKKPVSRELYSLIIRQLQDDGFGDVADSLSSQCELDPDSSLPTNALSDKLSGHQLFGIAQSHSKVNIDLSLNNVGMEHEEGLDPQNESLMRFGKYEARFQTTHKKPVRVTKFSRDGKLAASGCGNSGIKLYDVGKMHYSVLSKHSKRTDNADHGITRPIIRTYYDHEGKVNDLDFHPAGEWLISGGSDSLILYWNLHKSVKRSMECIQEHGAVRSLHCHPSGDYFISGGDYSMIRLYDTETMQGFVSKDTAKHTGPVTCVQWAPEGNLFASASKDGTIKIWDGVNMTCFNTIKEAHTGCEVSTLQFSKNSQFLLSNGKDSLVKLWDMSTGKCIMNYVGAHVKGMRVNACFSWNDEHVLTCSPRTNAVYAFDTKTGNIICKLRESKSPIKWVSSSPVEAAILTGSHDCRAKFYAVQEQDA